MFDFEQEENEFLYSSKTGRLTKNIKATLKDTLRKRYNIISERELEHKAQEMLKIHGMSPAHFDFLKNVEQMIGSQMKQDTVAGSVDDNSNKAEKSIKQIYADSLAPFQKIAGYDYLYRMMKQKYGKEEAKRLSGEMYSFALGLSDSTQILSVYCYAADFSKLVTEGRPWGQLHSAPAMRCDSYITMVTETVHEMSNHLAGAIAIGTLNMDLAHLLHYKDGLNVAIGTVTLEQLKTNKIIRKSMTNLFQTLIHSSNHLSRNSAESPFTNVSIFDHVKLKGLLNEMEFLFPDTDELKGEEKIDYFVEMILELQTIYCDIFEKGDQLHDGRPLTFPVSTINMSKVEDENRKYHIVDTDFRSKVAKRDLYRYNINVSEGNRVSMCCRFSNDMDLMRSYAANSNSFGGSGISIGSYRVNTIGLKRVALEATSVGHFKDILETRVEDAMKILSAHKDLIKKLTERKFQRFITNGWINPNNLFSTVGIIGMSEMDALLQNRFPNADIDYIEMALRIVEAKTDEYSRKYGLAGNIEEIPAESYAVRLPKSDRIIYGEDLVPEELYANQFIPLWEQVTARERMRRDGKYQKMLTGGGIAHFPISEPLTEGQYEVMLDYAVEEGCEHFAFNAVICECENGHNTFGTSDTDACSICGVHITTKRTRVVGFQTVVENWNKPRREHDFPNRVTYSNETISQD